MTTRSEKALSKRQRKNLRPCVYRHVDGESVMCASCYQQFETRLRANDWRAGRSFRRRERCRCQICGDISFGQRGWSRSRNLGAMAMAIENKGR